MEVIYGLIPIALALGLFFVILFIWATKDGQYDDLDTPAQRILLDDGPKKEKVEKQILTTNHQFKQKGQNDE